METQTLWTLPEALEIVPVAELDESVRSGLEGAEKDFAVTLPHSRSTTVLVDPHVAALLERFRQPRTLVDAVLLYALPRRLEAREMLEAAMPVVASFARKGFVVDAEDPGARRGVRSSLEPGDRVAGFEVVRPLQVMEDSELYQVRLEADGGGDRDVAVLKIERPEARKSAGSLDHEAEILDRLAGRGSPRLLRRGELDGRRFLLIEWRAGVESETWAAEWRGRRGGRRELLSLARAVARAYARLHRYGVLHGDVHPRNLLVGEDGDATLIDFGAARVDGAAGPDGRPGVAFYFEPEHARALLDGDGGLEVSAAGEQYAVAALLYRLVTGSYCYDFRLERRAMLRQLAEEPSMGFSERGVEPWPELEAALGRALARRPADRYPSMAGFAAALEAVPEPPAPSRSPSEPGLLERRARELLELAGADGPWLSEGLELQPRSPVVHGAAGIACALLHLACRRGDPELLATADLWSERAAEGLGREECFVNPEVDIGRDLIGHLSPFHTASGVHAMRAMVARARGDVVTYRRAAAGFRAAVDAAPEDASLDLTLGHAGVLLVCALLRDVDEVWLPPELDELAGRQLAFLRPLLDGAGSIDGRQQLGLAHGWAGQLYAVLRWCRAAGEVPPESLHRRLDELAARAEPAGCGLQWPWVGGGRRVGTMPGWCNGSAGFVYLYVLAWRHWGEERWLELARGAAHNVWESSSRGANLCCGLAGRAYALLHLYRYTEERPWLDRARDLARRAVRDDSFSERFPHSLYKGDLALVPLAADLEHPEGAAMPFFEE